MLDNHTATQSFRFIGLAVHIVIQCVVFGRGIRGTLLAFVVEKEYLTVLHLYDAVAHTNYDTHCNTTGGAIRTLKAERGGFEPPVPVTQYDSLANCWFQPLTHLSLGFSTAERSCRYPSTNAAAKVILRYEFTKRKHGFKFRRFKFQA